MINLPSTFTASGPAARFEWKSTLQSSSYASRRRGEDDGGDDGRHNSYDGESIALPKSVTRSASTILLACHRDSPRCLAKRAENHTPPPSEGDDDDDLTALAFLFPDDRGGMGDEGRRNRRCSSMEDDDDDDDDDDNDEEASRSIANGR
jgi:hypothetical protein